ncbi:MAG: protein translocase subunit SecD [Candidatus Lutibacillus vidarii]|nr:protein translocase subunit SecD [Candidatus Lutibacillus vidarii]
MTVALNPRTRGPRRALLSFVAIILALGALVIGARTWGTGQLTPKLGLDLEGGTEMVLEPVLSDSSVTVNQGQLDQARDIIQQRVNANGVAEATVTTQGGRNIVVSIPGQPTAEQLQAIRKPSQLRFRAVLEAAAGRLTPTSTPTATGTATGTSSGTPSVTTTTPAPAFTPAPGNTLTGSPALVPPALRADTTTPAPTATASSTSTGSGTATPTATPTSASDLAWVTPALQAEYTAVDCTKFQTSELVDDPAKPLITCSDDLNEKYLLGPVEVDGTDISSAVAGYRQQNGQTTNIVVVNLNFTSDGAKKFGAVTTRLYGLQGNLNRFAIVLDRKVISAPTTNAAILTGQAEISGNFTIESARSLAKQLQFGALPMSFSLQTENDISPTLGSEQLKLGLLAGLIGLLLVVGYSLVQYRLLGLVTVVSLVAAALLTYLTLTWLGWAANFRLTLAGVTGVIVSIGVTADSFIVYFERIRDEVREGRTLAAAVEAGWARARRTIIAADLVNLLAAVVLYILAASNVRGFAFTLGVTTLIDLLIVFLFTHPIMGILAHTTFFGGGHPWSGLSPDRLGAKTTRYVGAGRFVDAGAKA